MSTTVVRAGLSSTISSAGFLPAQAGQAGKYLSTDGTRASWETVSGGGGGITDDCPVFVQATAPSYADGPYLWFDITGGNLQIKYEDGL